MVAKRAGFRLPLAKDDKRGPLGPPIPWLKMLDKLPPSPPPPPRPNRPWSWQYTILQHRRDTSKDVNISTWLKSRHKLKMFRNAPSLQA